MLYSANNSFLMVSRGFVGRVVPSTRMESRIWVRSVSWVESHVVGA